MGKKDKRRKEPVTADVATATPVPRADRSADAMLRVVFGNHLALSKMADQKAHIMITICSAITALSLKQLFDPEFRYAAGTLVVFCLVAIFLGVYSTMPKLGTQPAPPPDDPAFNLLFFGHFTRLPYEEFEARLEALIHDHGGIHRSLARDLYSMGMVLMNRKYRYLDLCYRLFLLGLLVSTVVLGITLARVPAG